MIQTPSLLKICFALAVFLFVAPQAHALTITPIRYEIAGDPGQVVEETMTLINELKTSQVYYASFSNFEAQGETGSPTFVDPRDGLGTWITTDVASVNLAAGEQKDINFKITIPKDAEAGGHFAAIFWGTTPGSASNELSIGSKTGFLILLTVNGDIRESAGLVDFQLHNNKHFYRSLPVGFQYRFSNQGSDRVKPDGDIVIRSLIGVRAARVNANPYDGNVLPGTTRKFSPAWVKEETIEEYDQRIERNEKYSFIGSVKHEWHNFALGVFHARVVATFGTNHQTVKSKGVFFVVFPWELLLLVIPGIFLIFFVLRTIVRSYNRSVIRKAQAHFGNGQ